MLCKLSTVAAAFGLFYEGTLMFLIHVYSFLYQCKKAKKLIYWKHHLQHYSAWQSYRHFYVYKIIHSLMQPVLQSISHRD